MRESGPARGIGLRRRRHGFTMIEMLIVVMVGSVLLSIAIPAFGSLAARYQARSARTALVSTAARARAEAVQRGQEVELVVDAAGDWAVVRIDTDGSGTYEQILRTDFTGEYEADLSLSRNDPQVRVCYDPRGIGEACATTMSLPETIGLTLGDTEARVELQALGGMRQL